VSSANEHNYLKKIAELQAQGRIRPGTVFDTEIRHDAWCGLLLRGDRCDCDPEITLRPLSPPPDKGGQ
jgi:hypothetical protein